MNIKVIPQINKDAKTIQIDHLKEENLRLLREIEEIKSRMERILHYSPSDVLYNNIYLFIYSLFVHYVINLSQIMLIQMIFHIHHQLKHQNQMYDINIYIYLTK